MSITQIDSASRDTLQLQQQEILETKVDGPITVGKIVSEVAVNYDFKGHRPQYLSPLHRGLETQKYTFWAGQQSYLLKIYERSASQGYRFRLRNVMGLEQKMISVDVPFAASLPAKNGKHFQVISETRPMNRHWEIAFAVSEIFPGRPLTNPSLNDVSKMSEYMSRIHQIEDYGVVPAMDSWSFLLLPGAFGHDLGNERLKSVLDKIEPVVAKMKKLPLDDRKKFPVALVHGDLHSFNILKNPKLGIKILDLGCMDSEQRIADPVIFMTNACADFSNLELTRARFAAVINSYERRNQFTEAEKVALPTLLEANYAMFTLRTGELLTEEPENQEIKAWHEHGLQGLTLMNQLNFKVV
jgi:Ser/Thr protein kinase RdoA (MazF antagonist)